MFTGGMNMRQLRRFLIPSVTFFFCFIFFLQALAQEKLPEIVKKIEPSTVVILTYDKDGKIIGQGSGFFISKEGDIITNRHVLAGAHRAEVKTTSGKVYPITLIVAEDKEADIIRASVNITKESVRPLSLSSSIPEVGERVAVIGSPLGLERTVSDGIVSAVREIPAFGKIYQITAPISPGSSGSPVVNMRGEVIGVATFQFVEGQNLNFAIPGERIVKLKTEKGKTLDEWKMGKTEEWLSSAEGLYYLGLISLWADEYEKALPYFKKAVKKDPSYADAYFQIGFCSGELGHHKEAIEAFKQVIRIQPDYTEAHYNLGVTYAVLGRHTEAIKAYKEAIGINPDHAEAHSNLGSAYFKLGRYMEAIEAYKQVIRIKPGYAIAHYNLGLAYVRLERRREAIEAYKQAIRLQPDYAEAHYILGLEYLIIGDKGSALDQYTILKNLDNDLANELFNLIYK
jgi:Tfp pilus assembly protein PilF